MCWCMLMSALCPGGGWSALALCCSVRPGCVCSVCCVFACRVVRCLVTPSWACLLTVFAPLQLLPLVPCWCALSSGLVVRSLLPVVALVCSASVAVLRQVRSCCDVLPCVGVCCVVLFGVVLCPVVVRSVVVRRPPPSQGVVRCICPVAKRRVPACPVVPLRAGFARCPPPPPARPLPVVVPCVVPCCACCRVGPWSVVWPVLRFARCCGACLCCAGLLAPCCPAQCYAGSCFAPLSCAVVFSAVFLAVVHCLSRVLRAVSVCVVLCPGASCCLMWLSRVALLCWFPLRCAVWCFLVPWCVLWLCAVKFAPLQSFCRVLPPLVLWRVVVCLNLASPHRPWVLGCPSKACTPGTPCTSSSGSSTATRSAMDTRAHHPNTGTQTRL